jgi:hypothetical protein
LVLICAKLGHSPKTKKLCINPLIISGKYNSAAFEGV